MTENSTSFVILIGRIFALMLYLFTALLVSSCENNTPASDNDSASEEMELFTDDFASIKQRGYLRVLIPRTEGRTYLPRQGYPLDIELDQLRLFATKHKIDLVNVYVPDFDQLIPNLIDGYGDIIAANMTVTSARKDFIDFTLPIHHVRQKLVQRSSDPAITKRSQLENMRIAIKPSSSFWQTAQKLKDKYPSIKLISLANNLDIDEIFDKLVNNELDATIQDNNLLDSVLTYRDDIKTSLTLTREEPIAWGIRQDNPQLKKVLNRYVQLQELNQQDNQPHTTDWKDIKKRKVIRMITRNSAANYFLYRGELLGFEYELAHKFAEKNHLRLEVVVPPANENMFDWLAAGKGDFIAASLSPTKDRIKKDISFSRHYLKTSHQLVQRKSEPLINEMQQLTGRTIAIRKNSAYFETIKNLQDIGVKVEVEFVPEDLDTEAIINRVAIGQYDLTIADSHLLQLELQWREDIQSSLSLSEENNVGWVVRKNNPKLLEKINQFHRKTYRGLFYNLTYQKYFVNASHIQNEINKTESGTNQLSPYDEIVKKYASQYGFDWKLITAQMFQESRFNPTAKSWVGALGLLQVMPKTAEEFGFKNLKNPETGLHAGIKYLQWVQDRFDHELPVKDRMWFTLAAYNAGVGHVRDARRLARHMGWNSNRWFNNVERAMLLLRLKKYYRKARFGFVRGREPVNYVKKIKQHYEAYSKLTSENTALLLPENN